MFNPGAVKTSATGSIGAFGDTVSGTDCPFTSSTDPPAGNPPAGKFGFEPGAAGSNRDGALGATDALAEAEAEAEGVGAAEADESPDDSDDPPPPPPPPAVTVSVKLAAALVAASESVTVTENVDVPAAVGVPYTVPVAWFRANPTGNDPLVTCQFG